MQSYWKTDVLISMTCSTEQKIFIDNTGLIALFPNDFFQIKFYFIYTFVKFRDSYFMALSFPSFRSVAYTRPVYRRTYNVKCLGGILKLKSNYLKPAGLDQRSSMKFTLFDISNKFSGSLGYKTWYKRKRLNSNNLEKKSSKSSYNVAFQYQLLHKQVQVGRFSIE